MGLLVNPYSVAPSFTGLLDTYSGATAAYSVRKLRKAYSGSAIRVRRSNDSAEQDIGFDSNGNFDESALTTFVGANSGYVTTWYDQSGNARNATQTSGYYQPTIAINGTLIKNGGKVAIKMGVDNGQSENSQALFKLPSSVYGTFSGYPLISSFGVTTPRTTSSSGFIWSFQKNLFDNIMAARVCADGFVQLYTSDDVTSAAGVSYPSITVGTQYVHSALMDGSSGEMYINGGSQEFSVDTSSIVNGLNFDKGSIGGLQGSQAMQSNFQEVILFNSKKSSARTGIRDNINTYFGVY